MHTYIVVCENSVYILITSLWTNLHTCPCEFAAAMFSSSRARRERSTSFFSTISSSWKRKGSAKRRFKFRKRRAPSYPLLLFYPSMREASPISLLLLVYLLSSCHMPLLHKRVRQSEEVTTEMHMALLWGWHYGNSKHKLLSLILDNLQISRGFFWQEKISRVFN